MLYDHESRRQFCREQHARLADDARRTRAVTRRPTIGALIGALRKAEAGSGLDTAIVRELRARGRMLDPPLDDRVVRLLLFEAHRAWATGTPGDERDVGVKP